MSRGFKRNPRELHKIEPVRRAAKSHISSSPSRQSQSSEGLLLSPFSLSYMRKMCLGSVNLQYHDELNCNFNGSMDPVNLGSQSSSFSVSRQPFPSDCRQQKMGTVPISGWIINWMDVNRVSAYIFEDTGLFSNNFIPPV